MLALDLITMKFLGIFNETGYTQFLCPNYKILQEKRFETTITCELTYLFIHIKPLKNIFKVSLTQFASIDNVQNFMMFRPNMSAKTWSQNWSTR